jgi:hypothetical protein
MAPRAASGAAIKALGAALILLGAVVATKKRLALQ